MVPHRQTPSPNTGYAALSWIYLDHHVHVFEKRRVSIATPKYGIPLAGYIAGYIPLMKSMMAGWKNFLKIHRDQVVQKNIQYLELYCTRCFHFSPKCTKIVGGWGSAPDPAGGAYSASPDQGRNGMPNRSGKFSLTGPHYRAFSQKKNINLLGSCCSADPRIVFSSCFSFFQPKISGSARLISNKCSRNL